MDRRVGGPVALEELDAVGETDELEEYEECDERDFCEEGERPALRVDVDV